MRNQTRIVMLCLFMLLIVALSLCLFSPNIASSRFANINKLIKYFSGGQVNNQSRQTLTLYDWRLPIKLPPGHQSRADGLSDVDAIAIDGPSLINGKVYTRGILKFCDFATVTVETKQINGKALTTLSEDWGGWLCHQFGDYTVYDSIRQATPIKH